MWADEEVTRHIGGMPRSRQDVWSTLLRAVGHWQLMGYGYWIVERRGTGEFLGEAGFADQKRALPAELVTGPEAGWAFTRAAWGQGIATEAMRAALDWMNAAHAPAAERQRATAPAGGAEPVDSVAVGQVHRYECRRGAKRLNVVIKVFEPANGARYGNDMRATCSGIFGGGKCCRYLGRMMAVIINEFDCAFRCNKIAVNLKTTPHPLKTRQSGANGLIVNTLIHSNCYSSQRI